MSLVDKITSLAQAVGADLKSALGRLTSVEGRVSTVETSLSQQSSALVDGGTPSTPASGVLRVDFGGAT